MLRLRLQQMYFEIQMYENWECPSHGNVVAELKVPHGFAYQGPPKLKMEWKVNLSKGRWCFYFHIRIYVLVASIARSSTLNLYTIHHWETHKSKTQYHIIQRNNYTIRYPFTILGISNNTRHFQENILK